MRASYTGIGTIIHLIKSDLSMNSASAGMITTIPTIVFAVVCPLASMLSGRIGIGRMLEGALVFILIGTGLRGFWGAAGLFTGTVLLATGVGIMNALLIGLIKLRFPSHTGLVTSAYTTTMAGTTALFMGVNIYIAGAIGWRNCLAMWALPALAAVIIWGTQAFKAENQGLEEKPKTPAADPSASAAREDPLMLSLFKKPLAWILMIYMGTQSLMFYCISAWLPSILVEKGLSVESAAKMTTWLQVASISTTLLVPILCDRMNRQRLAAVLQLIYIAGAVLFFFSSSGPLMTVSVTLMALGMGSGFSFCVFLFSAKTKTPAQAAAVSGFAQCGGNIIAAVGPVLMGAIFDRTESWNAAMIFCFVIILIMSAAAYISTGRKMIYD